MQHNETLHTGGLGSHTMYAAMQVNAVQSTDVDSCTAEALAMPVPEIDPQTAVCAIVLGTPHHRKAITECSTPRGQ